MARLRFNQVGDPLGAINPITLGAGAGTCSWLTPPAFPTIAAPDYAIVVVAAGTAQEEVIAITGYTAGATTANVLRNWEPTRQGQNNSAAHTAAPWVHGPTILDHPVLPTVVASLAAPVSTYHQAPQVVLQGTFVAPTADFTLLAQGSSYLEGATYAGTLLFLCVGIPGVANNCGGIIGEEVTQTTPSTAPGTLLLYEIIGTNTGEFASDGFSRKVVVKGATVGATYTVQLIAGTISGLDFAALPTPTSLVTARMALGNIRGVNQRDIWIAYQNLNQVQRLSIGARILAAYEGVVPHLTVQNTLNTGTGPFDMAIDANGRMAVVNIFDGTVTLIDTTALGGAGTVVGTSPAMPSTIQYVAASPDGTGFWLSCWNGTLIKINPTTGAVITTVNVGSATQYGKLAINSASNTAYVCDTGNGKVLLVPLTSGANPPITTLATIGSPSALALSPDGTFLIIGCSGAAGTAASGAYKVTIGSATLSAQSARRGVPTQQPLNQVAISTDGRMYFGCGDGGGWWYGWTSDLAVYDGATAGGGIGTVANMTGLIVTENDGIYRVHSGGVAPSALVDAFPGTTFFIDPTDSANVGFYFAEVLLGSS